MPSWEEIKAVLDSPYVPADKKNRMMDAYDRDTFNFNEEQEEYAKKYLKGYAEDDNHGWDPEFGGDNGLRSAYDDAKADLDSGRAEEEQGTGAKDRASSALAALSPPTAGAAGTRNSNDVLDLGKPACDFFCQWIDQVWNKRPSGEHLDYLKEIWGRYNQDRNIDFSKLLADAEDLTAAHKVNDETLDTAKSELNTLFTEWKGEGATAARVKFEEKIGPDHQKMQEHIDGAAKLLPQVTSAVFDAVTTKVDSVLGLYRTTVAHAPLEMANKVVKIARKETDNKSDLLDVAGWVDSVCGSDLAARLQSDDCALNDENRDYAYDLCAKWVAGSFTPEFQGLLEAFNGYCETAQSTIERQFDALTGYLNGYHNEFTEPATTGRAAPPARTGGGGGVMPAASGSGSLPAAEGSGGGSAMPSVSSPSPTEGMEDPATVAEAVKKEAGEGINPFTGKPLEVDPATGQPYPVDPATGQAVKDAGSPETLTVRQGGNEIEMSEPAKDGTMEIKIDDGHGGAREFKLDWDGRPGQDTLDGQAWPAGEKAYMPGPDGKIQIEDGGLTITAERLPGPDSATAVTIDDGTGKPATYTLGREVHGPPEEQPSTAEAGPHQAVPGTQQASGFTAPGGIDIDHATASGTQVSEVDGSPSQVDDLPAAEGAGADQRTTAASFIDEDAAGSPSGAGIVSGTLGDAGALEEGAQAGLFLPPPVEAAVGVAPDPVSGQQATAGHQAAIGGSGFGGGGMSPAMGGMLGFAGIGEEPERPSRAYRVDGGIFDTSGAGGRISGSLDDDDLQVRF